MRYNEVYSQTKDGEYLSLGYHDKQPDTAVLVFSGYLGLEQHIRFDTVEIKGRANNEYKLWRHDTRNERLPVGGLESLPHGAVRGALERIAEGEAVRDVLQHEVEVDA